MKKNMLQIIVIVLPVLLFITSTPAFSASVEELVAQGDKYHQDFDDVDAVKQYQDAYQLDKDNFPILKKLVLAYNDAGEDYRDKNRNKAEYYFRNAIKYAEIAKKDFPEKDDNFFLLALAYGNLARYSSGKKKVELARDVEKNIKKMIKLQPDFAPAYVVLGVYYREVAELNWFLKQFAKTLLGGLPDGSLEDSKDMLQKAISLDPEIIYSHYELARTYESMNKYNDAIDEYRKVIELPVKDHLDPEKKEDAKKEIKVLAKKVDN